VSSFPHAASNASDTEQKLGAEHRRHQSSTPFSHQTSDVFKFT